MDEIPKMHRRSRPRPYDLRRKVLLKNFLREQMTYIPPASETSTASDSVFSSVSSVNIDISENVENSQDESNSNFFTIPSEFEPVLNTSTANDANKVESEKACEDNFVGNSFMNSVTECVAKPVLSKFSILSNLLKLKLGSKKRKAKGVTKAKYTCKTVKSPVKLRPKKIDFEKHLHKRAINTVKDKCKNTSQETGASKSFLSIFRKGNKNLDSKQSILTNHTASTVNSEAACSTSSQSVQTDLSWSLKELAKARQSNKLLREENRLLSESLSYFMSDEETNFNSQQNTSISQFSPFSKSSSDTLIYNLNSDRSHPIPRPKIVRSKSVQERFERRNSVTHCHRTRSMNSYEIRVDSLNPVRSRQHSHTRSFFSNTSNTDFSRLPVQYPKRSNVLRTLLVHGTGRTLQRRSSMPEKSNSENVKSQICRRTGSFRHYTRTVPFQSLPAEAFY